MAHATTLLFDSFKKELMNGSHALGTQAANGVRTVTTKDVLKAALFLTSDSTVTQTTTAYSTTGELAATGGYTAGGVTVTNANLPSNTGATAFWTPSAAFSWGPTFTSSAAFDCVEIYNSSSTGSLAIGLFVFGTQTVTSGTLTLNMPSNDSTNGLIRITS
jgi:hypothetical protein